MVRASAHKAFLPFGFSIKVFGLLFIFQLFSPKTNLKSFIKFYLNLNMAEEKSNNKSFPCARQKRMFTQTISQFCRYRFHGNLWYVIQPGFYSQFLDFPHFFKHIFLCVLFFFFLDARNLEFYFFVHQFL